MMKFKLVKKSIAFVANLALLFNSFVPFLLVAQPAYAQSPETVASTIEYNQSTNKLNITTDSSEKIAYQLFYKTNEKIDAIVGSDLNQSNNGSSFYLGTCSSGDCLPQKINRGILKIESNSQFYSKFFTIENNTLTVVKNIDSSQSDLTDEENNFLENINTSPLMNRRTFLSDLELISTPTSPSTPDCNGSSFDGLNLDSVNNQGGWSSLGSYDQKIVSNTYGFSSFGCKTLRLSNSVATGSFGDQTLSYSTANEAGETSATNGGHSIGTRQNHFEAQFDFASTQFTQQPGLVISVSPDRGDGSRMSYLRFEDSTDGINVFFDDVSGLTSHVSFNEVEVAHNLSRSTTHTAKFIMDFVDGPSNDVVKVYIDGTLVKTGTSWENYYRFDTEASTEQGPRITNDLIFRAGGDSVPANIGKGFLFDNVNLSSSTILPDTTVPIIDDFSITNPTNWGDNYNIYNLPNHKSIVSGLPTVGGNIKIGANFTDNEILTNVIAYLPGRGFFADSEFNPIPINNATWQPVSQGKYAVSWNTINGSDWRKVADGNYNFTFEARDKGTGQNSVQNSTTKTISLTVDNTPPTVEFTSTTPSEGSIIKGTINVAANFNDFNGLMNTMIGVHAIQWFCSTSWSGNGLDTCSIDTTKLPDGPQKLTIAAKDKAGNVSQIFRDVIIDNTAPIVNVTPAPGSLLHGIVTFDITITDAKLDPAKLTRIWTYLYNDLPPQTSQGLNLDLSSGHATFTVDTSKLADGKTSLDVGRLFDAAGNASGRADSYFSGYIIDNTAPSVPINGKPNNLSIPTNNFDFNWNSSIDNNSNVTYEFQSSLNPTQTNGILTTNLWHSGILPTNMIHSSGAPDGTWYWQVRAIDVAGNKSNWSNIWQVTLDTKEPSSIVNYSDTNPTNQSVVVTLVPNENITVTNNSGLTTYTFDQNGTFIFEFKDAAGNTGYALASVENIDKTAPATPNLILPIDGVYRHTSDTNSSVWSAVTDPSNVVYRYQSAPDTSFTNLYYDSKINRVGPLTDAMIMNPGEPEVSYFWRVQACDTLGNCSAWSTPRRINIDNTAPIITIGNYTTAPTNKDIIVTASTNEGNLNIGSTTFTANGLFDFIATDLAGNITKETVTITNIDKNPPAVPTLNSPSNNAFMKGVSVTNDWATISDAVKYVYESYTDQNAKNLRWHQEFLASNHSKTATNVADSTFYWRVKAVDAAGNESGWSELWKVTVDNTLPVGGSLKMVTKLHQSGLIVGTPTNGVYQLQNLSIDGADVFQSLSVIATDANLNTANVPVYIDNNEVANGYMAYDSTNHIWNYAGQSSPPDFKSNTHNLVATFSDNAGNNTTLTTRFTTDNTVPVSTISSPTNERTNSTIYSSGWDGNILGTASDLASGIREVQLSIQKADGQYWNGSVWQTGSVFVKANGAENWAYKLSTTLDDGSYTIKSHAIDNADNTENTYTLTIVLDKTIPEVGVSLDPTVGDAQNGWYKTQPEITLSGTDTNIYKIEYQWDSQIAGSWTPISPLTPFKLLTEGEHTLYYQATDKAGNISTGTLNLKWDQTDLELGPQNLSANPNPTSGSTSKIRWEMGKDNTGIDKYEIQWKLDDSHSYSKTVGAGTTEVEIDQLTEGRWSVKVIAFDQSGRTKDSSIDVVVDRTGPSAPVLALTNTGTGTATLSWNAIGDAKDYIVWYGSVKGVHQYGARVGNVTNYTVKGLGAGNYYFIVKAVDEAQNQSSDSNEINTGTIAGAAGTTPGQPAQGFSPQVLGASTETKSTSSSTSTPSEEKGSVLGTSNEKGFNWWSLLLVLFVIPVYFGGRKLLKNK